MDKVQLIIIFFTIVGVAGFAAIAYVFIGGAGGVGGQADIRDLMSSGSNKNLTGVPTRQNKTDPYELDVEALKKSSVRREVKSKNEDVTRKLFRAGYFTTADRQHFMRIRIACFAVIAVFLPIILFSISGSPLLGVVGIVLGVLIGYSVPLSWLERQIRAREESVMYFLPLVIEQVSIGVSSALDVGPCISQIIAMANERDSHNPVTEMFVHVEKLIRSGLNLEDALVEVGEANGMTEVKHAFMFLAQCSKHGGELSKQLQELADSVMVQRQVQVEGKIASLPVKATGPLAMVFAGFFALLLSGLLVRLLSAFGGE